MRQQLSIEDRRELGMFRTFLAGLAGEKTPAKMSHTYNLVYVGPWRIELDDEQDEVFIVNDALNFKLKPTAQLMSSAIEICEALNRVYS